MMLARTLLLSTAGLVFASCSGPDIHEPDVIRFQGEDYDPDHEAVNDIRVEVRNYVEDDLEVEETSAAMRDGRLSAQFRALHEGDEALHLTLTWIWKDADGIALRVAAGGQDVQRVVLQAGQDRVFSRTSPRPGALRVECRIETRGPSKER